jgi:hypothetical protein
MARGIRESVILAGMGVIVDCAKAALSPASLPQAGEGRKKHLSHFWERCWEEGKR